MPDAGAIDYAVPRNPAVPSPAFGDVITSEPLTRDRDGRPAGDRVRVYRGGEIPPPGSTLLDTGPLVCFERGLLFVATTGHPEWREVLQQVGEMATKRASSAALELALDVALPMHEMIARPLRSASLENFVGELTGHDPVKEQVAALELRLSSGHTLALPYVNIVRVRSERAWRWGRLRNATWIVLTLETSSGETTTYCVAGLDPGFPGHCMRCRFEQEFLHLARAVWNELLDLQGLWRSLTDRYPNLSTVVVGRVWDDWKGNVQARVAARQITQAQVAALVLRRLEPLLPHYRRIPRVLERIQTVEPIARGQTS